jgi:transcriptional regulator GlxA family with amidase domain
MSGHPDRKSVLIVNPKSGNGMTGKNWTRIYQEIRRVRVNHIIQLLVGTDMNVTEIAIRSGFEGVGHVSRYFREEMGMSLRDYRNKYALR